MGVESRTIVMVGINIPSSIRMHIDSDEYYDSLALYSSYEEDITYVDDGMSGNYLYVGKILAYSEDMYSDFSLEIEYNNSLFKLIANDVENHVYEKFGLAEDAKLIVFNHIY